MKHTEIYLTEHVLLRYIERFNQNLNSITNYQQRLDRAKVAVKSMIEQAHYVSDNPSGVLLYSKLHNCNFIVRNKRLITLYTPVKKKTKARENKTKDKI